MDPHSIDPIKKRKLDENGLSTITTTGSEPGSIDPTQTLTQSDTRKILEPFTIDQLRDILSAAAATHADILAAVRAIADRDVTLRKLFIRGLGWETTSDSLSAVFAAYGVLDEAVVILDKSTGKSKGYGFVTYRHVDGAVMALKQPSKLIDGRMAVAALASAGLGGGGGGVGGGGGGGDTSLRKIYVGNVPQEMGAERLLSVFSSFGEIEEGPLGFDKATGKSKGFALFVYKTVEAAQAALIEPMKVVDGRQLVCKLASEGKKGKPPGGGEGMGMGMGMAPPSSGGAGGPGGGGYSGPGGPGGYSSYSGFSGTGQQPSNPMNPSYNSSVGGQGPGGYGGNAGYGSGGGYGGGSYYGSGPNSGGYGGYGGSGSAAGGVGSGGAGRGGYGGMAPNSGGMPSGGGYSDGGHYGMSSGGYPSQPYQHTGASPAPRVPPAGAGGYPNPPPYY
ncbi:UBP1-associated protein 2C-like [Silene latifolia]|uniref:UBP1-associated protein 2C-like n=1 Tax=Silene latifolia TaxID=37657 RepID=UPI003D77FA8C